MTGLYEFPSETKVKSASWKVQETYYIFYEPAVEML